MKLFLWFGFFVLGASSLKERFDDYQVYRLIPKNSSQVEIIKDLEVTGEYDFWTLSGSVNTSSDVLVPPEKAEKLQEFIRSNEIEYYCLIENVQSLIDAESPQVIKRCRDMDWTNYHSLEEIVSWINDVSKAYPYAKKISAGKSFEGRKITGLEISFKENTTGIFIESGMHGREWIAPAATSWMVKQILDSPVDSVFRNFSYYYFPVVNPDGYSYSWNFNRLWKKTRTRYKNGSVICHGADPNKNWDFRWKDIKECGNPCSETYPGPFAFSEIEMKSMANYLKCIARSRNVDIYLSYRSYSQLLLYPWDSQRSPAPQSELWQRIGESAIDALTATHGTEFEVGNSCRYFYPSGGGSNEWYYGLFNATISYIFQLRDRGNHAFFTPSSEIIPTGEELLPALEKILIEYQKLNITRPDPSLDD